MNATHTPSLTTPFYFQPTPSVVAGISDKYLSLAAPVLIYWLVSFFYHLLDTLRLPFTEQYRLHEPEEITLRNRVAVRKVIFMVLVQQLIQTVVGLVLLENDSVGLGQTFADHSARVSHLTRLSAPGVGWWIYWWMVPVAQFGIAFFVLDAWQYALHRLFHESRFLYRHFHSHHHRLYVPYAFGALYNHPVEGLLLDSAGAVFAHFISQMTVRQGILLFTFSTLKTVSDHGGYAFPWWIDPLHLIFPNCAEYHDVHHQMKGLKFNYSQPFFVHFDVWFGTRIDKDSFARLKGSRQKQKQL